MRRATHLLSWLAGLAGLAVIAWYFRSIEFAEQVRNIGVVGLAGWLVMTLGARIIQVEITVTAVGVLGFTLRRLDAFWIGWIRTFANQILPFSGLVVFAHEIRRKIGIPWAEFAALSGPLFVHSAAALGLLGVAAVCVNLASASSLFVPMLVAFLSLLAVAVLFTRWTTWLVKLLPGSDSTVARQTVDAFERLSASRTLTATLVVLNALVLLFRGSRLLLMFVAIGVNIDLASALLLVVVSESVILIQITPGGLGLREGAIIGGAALVGIPPEAAATIALVDRLLVVGLTTALAFPAYLSLRYSTAHRTTVI